MGPEVAAFEDEMARILDVREETVVGAMGEFVQRRVGV